MNSYVSSKLMSSPISQIFIFISECRTMYSDGLGFVDFLPADSFAVVYITEAELLTPKSFTERTNLLAKVKFSLCN